MSAPTLVVELREIAQATIRSIIEALKELSIPFPHLKASVEVISNVVSIAEVRVLVVQVAPSELLTYSSGRNSGRTLKIFRH